MRVIFISEESSFQRISEIQGIHDETSFITLHSVSVTKLRSLCCLDLGSIIHQPVVGNMNVAKHLECDTTASFSFLYLHCFSMSKV